jgi:hypothetical protein
MGILMRSIQLCRTRVSGASQRTAHAPLGFPLRAVATVGRELREIMNTV